MGGNGGNGGSNQGPGGAGGTATSPGTATDGQPGQPGGGGGDVVVTATVGPNPLGLATDGTSTWTANQGGNTLSRVTNATGAVLTITLAGTDTPWDVALNGNQVWVVTADGTNPGVYVLDVTDPNNPTQTQVDNGTVECRQVTVSPDGRYAYVSDLAGGSVYIFDTANVTANVGPVATLSIPCANGVAVTSDSKYLYVSTYGVGGIGSDSILAYDVTNPSNPALLPGIGGIGFTQGTGIAIHWNGDGTDNVYVGSGTDYSSGGGIYVLKNVSYSTGGSVGSQGVVHTDSGTAYLAVSNDGAVLYGSGTSAPGSVYVVDTASLGWQTKTVSQNPGGTWGIALNPTNSKLIVSSNNNPGSVSIAAPPAYTGAVFPSQVVRTISVGDNPQNVVVNPKTGAVYVLNYGVGAGSLSEIAVGASTSTEVAVFGASSPLSAVVSADGSTLYVGELNNGLIDVFDATGPLSTPSFIGAGNDIPQSLVLGIANSGSAGFLYIGSGQNVPVQGLLPAVDPNQRVYTQVGDAQTFRQNWLAMSTNGNTLYTSNKDENALFLLDTSVPIDPATAPIDPNSGLPIGPPVTGGPIALAGPSGTVASVVAVNPVSGAVYVLGNDYTNGNAYVSVLDASGAFTTSVQLTGLDQAYGSQSMAISPNGTYLYVTSTLAGGSLAGQVTVYNTTTNYSVATTLTGFTNPYGVAFSPDGQTVYVVNDSQIPGSGTVTVLGL
ncbi:MAG: hypothetical protein WCC69_02760 [Pirellulales bacterium]